MRADYMRRISICQFSTYRWNFSEDAIRYATHGFDSIGIWRRKLDEFGVEAASDLLHETKLSVSSLHWAGGFTGDGRSFPAAIDDAIESIATAARLSAGCLILHPGSRNGHTTSNARRLLKSALDILIPVAADFEVRLALEPIITKRVSPWTFIDTFEETLDVVQQYSPRQLGLVLDSYEVGLNSQVYEKLDQVVNRIELVQVADRTISNWQNVKSENKNDSYRLPLGLGNIRFDRWLARLQELGYEGPIEVEVHGCEVQNQDYFEFLDDTRKYFESSKIERYLIPQSAGQRLEF